jgi:DNA-binding GntR family transcriptional regulator
MTASKASNLKILQSRDLPSAVKDELRTMILSGAIRPGEKLGEAEIADRLEVSRGPVREAFRSLEETGLVRLHKNRGVFVRDIGPTESFELYELRAGFDEMAGKLLASKVLPVQINELSERNSAMRDCLERGAADESVALNLAFHDRIVEMTGNRRFLGVYRRIMDETRLVRMSTLAAKGGLQESIRQHQAIIDALAAKDGDEAGRVMRAHVLSGRQRYAKLLGEADGDSAWKAGLV